MGAIGNYFLDGPNLQSSSAVYTSLALTTKAADGFYSDNQIVREQVNGVLQATTTCADCAADCDTIITVNSAQDGYYTANFETKANLGVARVVFNPYNCSDGFRFIQGNSVFNEVSSQSFGYLSSSNPDNYVVLGNSATGGCGDPVPGTFSLDKYIFEQNGQFNQIAGSESVTFEAGDSAVQVGAPGECVGYYSKQTNNNDIIEIQIAATYANSDFQISVECPKYLTPSSISNGCDDLTGEGVMYNVPVNGSDGIIGLYDWVFQDNLALTKVAAGNYVITNINSTITVDSNGVVTNIVACPTASLRCFNVAYNGKSTALVDYNDGNQIAQITLNGGDDADICALQGSIQSGEVITITGGVQACTDNDDCQPTAWVAELCASYPAFFGTTQVIAQDSNNLGAGVGSIVKLANYGDCFWEITAPTTDTPSDIISSLLSLETTCDKKCYTYTIQNNNAANSTFSYLNCNDIIVNDTIVGLATKDVCARGTSFTLSKGVVVVDEVCGCSG